MKTSAIVSVGMSLLLGACGGAAPSPTIAPTPTATAIAPVTAAPTSAPTSTRPAGGDLTWQRADPQGALAGPGREYLSAVVAGGPGLVAVGSVEIGGEADAAVWVSTDGYRWTEVLDDADALGGPGIQMMSAVTAGGPGLVAVGIDDPQGSAEAGFVNIDAAAWVSTDGLAWTRVPHDDAVFGGPERQRMIDVTAAGPGLVAVGIADDPDGSPWPEGAVWVSADGYAWSRVDDPATFGGNGGQEILSVTAGGPGVVAVGTGEPYDGAAVWTSEDGRSWSRVAYEADVFGSGSEMRRVMAGGPGLVAVGGTTLDVDEPQAWASADGYSWIRTAGGTIGPSMRAAAPWQGGLAVAGTQAVGGQTSVVFWLSADGINWHLVEPDQEVFGDAANLPIVALSGWQTGLILLAGDTSTEDWDGVVWVSP